MLGKALSKGQHVWTAKSNFQVTFSSPNTYRSILLFKNNKIDR